jgi:hypothetical protein
MPTRSQRHPLPRRRPRPIVAAVAVAFVLIQAAALPAHALIGPEPGSDPFLIDFVGEEDFWHLRFDTATGWDFADRESYRCALVEFFQNGQLAALVEFERLAVPGRDENYLILNDRYGAEHHDGPSSPPFPDPVPTPYDPDGDGDICGLGRGAGALEFEHTDHFPHGTQIDLISTADDSVITTIDLHAPGTWPQSECVKPYWVPGNEPGEAYLWWDEDLPVEVGMGGPVCDYGGVGGGPMEAFAVARAFVRWTAPGIGACTRDWESGDRCTGAPPPSQDPHHSTVTLQLRGHLRAFGFVRAHGGADECLGNRTVRVQRRASGSWRTAGTDLTTDTGRYSVVVADRAGTYRTRVVGVTLASGMVCQTGVSHKRVYEP